MDSKTFSIVRNKEMFIHLNSVTADMSSVSEDLAYIVLLLTGIGFGPFYRKIVDKNTKLWTGTVFGLLLVLLTSRIHAMHSLCSFLVSFAIIKLFKRNGHLICFWFLMLHWLIFNNPHWIGFSKASQHTKVIQMMLIMKLTGFAFEMNSVVTKIYKAGHIKEDKTEYDKEMQDISMVNMFHYCFSYFGILTVPHYTYKTFHDHFNLPFAVNAECWKATLERFKWTPLFFGFYLITNHIWTWRYALTDEFYTNCNLLYRLGYIFPIFLSFRLRLYSGFTLSECVCISAGLGAYPKELDSRCGHGPSKPITKEMIDNPEGREYDFETIKTMDVRGFEMCITFREAFRHWNLTTQFWLVTCIYKRFPIKSLRTVASFIVCAYWHGTKAGYYFCLLFPIFYLQIEDLFIKLMTLEKASRIQKLLTNSLFWCLKMFSVSNMVTAFLLQDFDKIWRFYSSVYYIPCIIWALLCIGCVFWSWKRDKNVKCKEAQSAVSKKFD